MIRNHPPAVGLLLAVFLVAAGGCRWNQMFRRTLTEPTPVAFTTLPTRDEAVAALNANSGRIQALQTQGATVSVPGAPSIGAEIALERPRKLRFRAGGNLIGQQLDLGSNDQLFWFWAALAPEPSVFFARHDQFATSRARQMLAIEPTWLIDALGVVQVDPATILEDPTTAGDNRVQLKTTLQASAGQFTRQILLHARYGWVQEQHLYDAAGRLVASALNSRHEYSAVDGVSLPKRIEVSMPDGQLRFQLDVDRWVINQPPADAQALFELPRAQLADYPFVDLADPNFVPPGGTIPAAQPAQPAGPAPPPYLQADIRQHYRGYGQR
ncbi:MAG: hypothetical protein SFU86_15580 [Pirellulaceae bacterium]|nr:hypothetical protein [Pirellulaceae bacterium]